MDSVCKPNYIIRVMTKDDISDALTIFDSYGLYESAATVEAFLECDPQAFYVAVSHKDGKIIGVCCAPVIEGSAFVGLYAVLKEYHNQGIGLNLFNCCMKHVGDRNCGLAAIPDMFDVYHNKAGFKVIEGRSMVVFEGRPTGLDKLHRNNDITVMRLKCDDVESNNELFKQILEYDTNVHTFSREKVLQISLTNADYRTHVAINNDIVVGFGCMRPFPSNNHMIGPVYADNDLIAETLIADLVGECNFENSNILAYFTLDSSEAGLNIANKLQLKETERCERMFTKFVTPANHQFIYCLFSPNFLL